MHLKADVKSKLEENKSQLNHELINFNKNFQDIFIQVL